MSCEYECIMRSSTLSPIALVLGSFLFACAGSSGDDLTEGAGSAASEATSKITTGDWGALKLVVANGTVSGTFASTVGDPALSQTTCAFTVGGTITSAKGDRATIVAADGSDATVGEIFTTTVNGKLSLSVRTSKLLNACDRAAIDLAQPSGFVTEASKKLAADVAGYRTVSSEKAFFYDSTGGAPRSAYVVRGDTVVITGADASGFVKARFEGKTVTTGFLKASDLTAPGGPAAPLVKKYEMPKNDYIDASFEVTKASASSITFSLGAVRLTGGNNEGDLEGETATIKDGVATWKGDGCTLAFVFTDGGKRANLAQDGQCSDFGANVIVDGSYLAK